jgi:hypothetical protein
MSPVGAGAQPEPLVPGVKCLLVVEAGSQKGTNDFKVEGIEFAQMNHQGRIDRASNLELISTLRSGRVGGLMCAI